MENLVWELTWKRTPHFICHVPVSSAPAHSVLGCGLRILGSVYERSFWWIFVRVLRLMQGVEDVFGMPKWFNLNVMLLINRRIVGASSNSFCPELLAF